MQRKGLRAHQSVNRRPGCEVSLRVGLTSPNNLGLWDSVADAKLIGNWVLARWSHNALRTPYLGFDETTLRPRSRSVNTTVGTYSGLLRATSAMPTTSRGRPLPSSAKKALDLGRRNRQLSHVPVYSSIPPLRLPNKMPSPCANSPSSATALDRARAHGHIVALPACRRCSSRPVECRQAVPARDCLSDA